MSTARLVPPIALVLLLPACAHSTARAGAPAGLEPEVATAARATPMEIVDEAREPAPAGKPAVAQQTIVFGEDEPESEPTTQIRSAPKRPPIPSFELFGTRKSDGP